VDLARAASASLPPDTVDYTAAIINAVERGTTFALNGWLPPPGQERG
jgi:hypothetical protein